MTVIIVSAILGFALAGTILYLVRRDHLHGSFAVWWLAIALGTLGIGVFPHLIDRLGETIGIAYPPILVILLGMGMILIRMLLMDVDRSRQERALRRLTQRLAILDQELTQLRAQAAKNESGLTPVAEITSVSRRKAQVIALPKSGGDG